MMAYKFMDAKSGEEAKSFKNRQEVRIRKCVPLDKLKLNIVKLLACQEVSIHECVPPDELKI